MQINVSIIPRCLLPFEKKSYLKLNCYIQCKENIVLGHLKLKWFETRFEGRFDQCGHTLSKYVL